jgi:hypothetical protein
MAIIGSIFTAIQVILRLLGLWDQFLNWSDAKRIADAEKNTQDRNDAVDKQKGAKSEDDFDKAQDDIISHKPH